jgi:hypothetical protein
VAKPLLLDPEAVRRRLASRFRHQHRQWFGGEGRWPVAIPLGAPTERQAQAQRDAVLHWETRWRRWQGEGELIWAQRRWRGIGDQELPERLLLHSPEQLVAWLGEGERWQRGCSRRQRLLERWPRLGGGIARYFSVLADAPEQDFQRLVSVLEWLIRNPASGLYVRQLPVAGIHTKWVEARKALLMSLLRAIRGDGEDGDFFRVTGIRHEPASLRFRLLDDRLRRLTGGLGDIAAPVDEIAGVELPVERVLIVENLKTGLAFEDLPGTLLVMGLGYAVDLLEPIAWMRRVPCWYWGDIDTHGFAILNRLRHHLPDVRSLLMDEATLVGHLALCGTEENQAGSSDLDALEEPERRLCTELMENRWGERIRLEQERIGWSYAWERIITAMDVW